jgi:bisanhydrobacterioruberin hydratase
MSKTSFSLPKISETNAITFMSILYFVGILGFVLNIHPDFPLLTPINLIISLVAALYFHRTPNRAFWLACGAVGILGYLIEVAGVNTGLIFGAYQYGRVLGFKLWNTPLSIGVNWVLLVYTSSICTNYFLKNTTPHYIKSLIAAALMVALDILIEPVAIATDMWRWNDIAVPFQNYIGWFISAFLLHLIISHFTLGVKNKVAVTVFIWQCIFFIILNFQYYCTNS